MWIYMTFWTIYREPILLLKHFYNAERRNQPKRRHTFSETLYKHIKQLRMFFNPLKYGNSDIKPMGNVGTKLWGPAGIPNWYSDVEHVPNDMGEYGEYVGKWGYLISYHGVYTVMINHTYPHIFWFLI